MSVIATALSPTACVFSLSQSPEDVLADIAALKEQISDAFDKAARKQPTPAIGELIRKLKS